jgi:transcriptional regulator with XRE-family HTH domain
MTRRQTAASLLRELRRTQAQSLRTTAADLGLAPSYLSRLERGERSCTTELSQRLADYYGVSHEVVELAEGRVPADIVAILTEHPEELTRLRELYGQSNLSEDNI